MSGVSKAETAIPMRANETLRLVPYGQARGPLGLATGTRVPTECH